MANGGSRRVDKVELLAQAVSRHVADGYRVESQSDIQAVLNKKKVSGLKFFLCCFWWPGFFMDMHKKDNRVIIRIDDTGNALIQEV